MKVEMIWYRLLIRFMADNDAVKVSCVGVNIQKYHDHLNSLFFSDDVFSVIFVG